MNKENQSSVTFVLISIATAVIFLFINLKYSIYYVLPILGTGWLMINHWNLLVRVWKTIPRDVM